MSQTISRGQISFVDLNDGKSISLYLVSNQALMQLYDVDLHTYSPDYTVSPYLVISPNLFISGKSGNQISHISGTPTWKINGTNATSYQSGVSIATSAPYTLTISANNIASSSFMTITCELNYADEDTELVTPATAQITFSLVDTTGELIRAIAYSMDKTIFYNDVTEGNQTITIHCDMWRGATIDATNVSYQWFRKDDPEGADAYDWHKIVASYSGTGGAPATGTLPDGSSWKEVLKGYCTGYTTNELTVDSRDVLNYDAFMCLCTDTDSDGPSNTYNESVRSDTVTILDWTDPFTLDFKTPAGTSLTPGTSSITTNVSVWQKGEELADSVQNAFYYCWTKANKNGTVATGTDLPTTSNPDIDDYKASGNKTGSQAYPPADSNWAIQTVGGTSLYCRYATGSTARSLTIYKDEISVKNTFFVEVIIP